MISDFASMLYAQLEQSVGIDPARYILAAAVVIFAPIFGGLLAGLDRKITARAQGRVGPPILQSIYDVIKLFRKESIALNRVQILYAYLHLALMMLVVALLVLRQDMLMILFVHAFSTIALILGGMSVRSPYSRMGSHRTIMQMIAYEPILILMVVGIYLSYGTFNIAEIHTQGKPMLVSLPLVFLAFLAAIAIKLQKSPFDVATSHHAHQELVKGVTIEYSGPYLGVLEVTHFYETATLFGLITAFYASNLWIGAGIAAVCFLGEIILDNAFARLTTRWMVRFMWSIPLMLALSNVIWLYLQKGDTRLG